MQWSSESSVAIANKAPAHKITAFSAIMSSTECVSVRTIPGLYTAAQRSLIQDEWRRHWEHNTLASLDSPYMRKLRYYTTDSVTNTSSYIFLQSSFIICLKSTFYLRSLLLSNIKPVVSDT
jgi:hypothetical protein